MLIVQDALRERQLLGGASREKVPCYTHAQRTNIAEAVDAVGKCIKHGYKAVCMEIDLAAFRTSTAPATSW
jgi:L-alanine-DL-glutamate epimerase-like enolase superfamily enzyme